MVAATAAEAEAAAMGRRVAGLVVTVLGHTIPHMLDAVLQVGTAPRRLYCGVLLLLGTAARVLLLGHCS